jgi:periplasmic protein TonB
MSDASLLHLVIPAPRLPHRHAPESVAVAAALHALAAAVLISLALMPGAAHPPLETKDAAAEAMQPPRIVFLQVPGPGGGGGGGGNRNPSPPSRAQNVGRDRITLPAARPVQAQSDPVESLPSQLVVLPSVPLASGTQYQAGMPDAQPSLILSQGPGVGGGVGTGSGSGIGSGTGPGFGPGSGGGFGGGVHHPGNGVTAPTLRSQVRPNYTPNAMQRRIQGTVVLEAIVGADGVPYGIRVVRSLDPHGLDEEAIGAASQWRFNPGRKGETPVDVLVIVVIDFHLR